jgi:hypothetical protein
MSCRAKFTFVNGICLGMVITHDFDRDATVSQMKQFLVQVHHACDPSSQSLTFVWEEQSQKITNEDQTAASFGAMFSITVNTIKKSSSPSLAAASIAASSVLSVDPTPTSVACPPSPPAATAVAPQYVHHALSFAPTSFMASALGPEVSVLNARDSPSNAHSPKSVVVQTGLESVHSTQELRAVSHTKTTPPVERNISTAAPAFRGGSFSPTFGGGVTLFSNVSSGSAVPIDSRTAMSPFGSVSVAAPVFDGSSISAFCGRSTVTSTSLFAFPSAAPTAVTAVADATLSPQTEAIAATSSGTSQLCPTLLASSTMKTAFAAPSSVGFGNSVAPFFGSSVPLFGTCRTAAPVSGYLFPSVASNPFSAFSFLGSGSSSAVFGGGNIATFASSQFSFSGLLTGACGNSAHVQPQLPPLLHRIKSSDSTLTCLRITESTDITKNVAENGFLRPRDLARALPLNSCITSLHLHNMTAGPAGVALLFPALTHLTAITSLSLGSTYIASSGARRLCKALTHLMALTTLDLGSTWIESSGARHLCLALLHLTALTILDLTNNNMTADDGACLCGAAAAAGMSRLKELDLSANDFRAASVVKCGTWRQLNLPQPPREIIKKCQGQEAYEVNCAPLVSHLMSAVKVSSHNIRKFVIAHRRVQPPPHVPVVPDCSSSALGPSILQFQQEFSAMNFASSPKSPVLTAAVRVRMAPQVSK